MKPLRPAAHAMAIILSMAAGCWIPYSDGEGGDEPEDQALAPGPHESVQPQSSSERSPSTPPDSVCVSVDFTETPLKSAIEALAKQSGATIFVDPAVYWTKTEDELLIELKLVEVPLQEALALLTGLKGLRLAKFPGYFYVAGEETSNDLRMEVIDVRDLISSIGTDRFECKFREDDPIPPKLELQEDWATWTSDELISFVRDEAAWGAWDTLQNSISFRQGNLIVRNSSHVIEEVRTAIQRLKDCKGACDK